MSGPQDTGGVGDDAGPSDDRPVSTLRGAGVQVDTARAARVAVTVALAAVVIVAGVLLIAGYRKNSQIDELRDHGVPVELTVTGCYALMGGSGSNAAGYDCSGTYVYGGRTYTEDIPGNTLHAKGTTVRGVVASGDPALFSTPSTVDAEHPSASVYIAPAVLLLAFVAAVGWIVVRNRRRRLDG
ncbi:MAG: hypothetical protein ABSF84_10225 [Acidimicrobiales bacterium]|jgi:hypothetical protein